MNPLWRVRGEALLPEHMMRLWCQGRPKLLALTTRRISLSGSVNTLSSSKKGTKQDWSLSSQSASMTEAGLVFQGEHSETDGQPGRQPGLTWCEVIFSSSYTGDKLKGRHADSAMTFPTFYALSNCMLACQPECNVGRQANSSAWLVHYSVQALLSVAHCNI